MQVVKRRQLSSIPAAATARPFTPEELERLAKAHKDRLWELVGRVAPAILKAVRAHKVHHAACCCLQCMRGAEPGAAAVGLAF